MLADEKLGDPARTDELFPPYDPIDAGDHPERRGRAGGACATEAAATAAPASDPARPPPQVRTGDARRRDAAWRDVADRRAADPRDCRPRRGRTGLAGDHERRLERLGRRPVDRTTTETALLANDPHLGIGMPSVWFIERPPLPDRSAQTCPCDVAGVTFPGVPGVVLGHNARIAWGATNVDPDVEDLFVEYSRPGATPTATSSAERVDPVRGPARDDQGRRRGADVELDVRATRHGADPQRRRHAPQGRAAPRPPLDGDRRTSTGRSRRSSTSRPPRTSTSSRPRSRPTARPSQNFVYADVDGHIGYVLPGRIPIRADGADQGDRAAIGQRRQARMGRLRSRPTSSRPSSTRRAVRSSSANNAAVDAGVPVLRRAASGTRAIAPRGSRR